MSATKTSVIVNPSETEEEDKITSLRLKLLRNGYHPIPVTNPDMCFMHWGKNAGKAPGISDWQLRSDADEAMIRSWRVPAKKGSQWTVYNSWSTGILTGHGVVGADVDVLSGPLAKKILGLATEILGYTDLLRVGRLPKHLLVYQFKGDLAKMQTKKYVLPDGTDAQVEIMAKGQQFVGFGFHPVTRLEYKWLRKSPEAVNLKSLPMVGAEKLKQFLSAAEAAIVEAGGVAKITEQKVAKAKEPPPDGFFPRVNKVALERLDDWFPTLFIDGRKLDSGVWRVTSESLGRNLQEDISFYPEKGGKDYGEEIKLSAQFALGGHRHSW